jgi:hypothetical protein
MVELDGEVEICSEMEIKEEPESDDDYELKIADGDTEDEDIVSKVHGQTSLDLASNRKDVSFILEFILCCVFTTDNPKHC